MVRFDIKAFGHFSNEQAAEAAVNDIEEITDESAFEYALYGCTVCGAANLDEDGEKGQGMLGFMSPAQCVGHIAIQHRELLTTNKIDKWEDIHKV